MKINLIEANALKETLKQNQILLIDVREPEEWAEGHIEGAKLLPLGQIAHHIQAHCQDRQTPVYFYCQHGHRSEQAALILLSLGYTHVTHLVGGYAAWLKDCPVS
jgi:rhodanese-related sulfurtransferase